MKMHPKPMIRHTLPVIECAATVERSYQNPLPVHIVLSIDGKTQRVCMLESEARQLAVSLLGARS